MNMRKHEGNTLIKFCAETKANSKGEPAKKKKLYLTLIYGTSEDAQRELAAEMAGKGKAANGAHKENHVSCRTLQALSVVGQVCEYVSTTANI